MSGFFYFDVGVIVITVDLLLNLFHPNKTLQLEIAAFKLYCTCIHSSVF